MCPHCKSTVGMQVYSRFVADLQPDGLPGARIEIAAQPVGTLTCRACGWYCIGHLEGARLDAGTFAAGWFVPDSPPVRPR
jgi:hypothetical protein